MKQTVIHDGPHLTIASYGNGMAYEVIRKKDCSSFFIQGDDADQFREDVIESNLDYDIALDFNGYSELFH